MASLLNDWFVSIKVDREELPEIDHVYMTVCQGMTGSGGWPLTIIMTPEMQPFYAGTYLPKDRRGGRPGLFQLLPIVNDAWTNKRDEIMKSVDEVQSFLIKTNSRELGDPPEERVLDIALLLHGMLRSSMDMIIVRQTLQIKVICFLLQQVRLL